MSKEFLANREQAFRAEEHITCSSKLKEDRANGFGRLRGNMVNMLSKKRVLVGPLKDSYLIPRAMNNHHRVLCNKEGGSVVFSHKEE
jgi:hypothetical protein